MMVVALLVVADLLLLVIADVLIDTLRVLRGRR
jgi:hypothetical protein